MGYPFTKRFAFFVGRRCRVATIKDVAQATRLDWKTVKVLGTQWDDTVHFHGGVELALKVGPRG